MKRMRQAYLQLEIRRSERGWQCRWWQNLTLEHLLVRVRRRYSPEPCLCHYDIRSSSYRQCVSMPSNGTSQLDQNATSQQQVTRSGKRLRLR